MEADGEDAERHALLKNANSFAILRLAQPMEVIRFFLKLLSTSEEGHIEELWACD